MFLFLNKKCEFNKYDIINVQDIKQIITIFILIIQLLLHIKSFCLLSIVQINLLLKTDLNTRLLIQYLSVQLNLYMKFN